MVLLLTKGYLKPRRRFINIPKMCNLSDASEISCDLMINSMKFIRELHYSLLIFNRNELNVIMKTIIVI